MKIEYRILWVDDSEEWVEAQLENIEEYLSNYGFVLKYDVFPSYKKIDFSQYDIIAVDCNLGDSEKGIDALKIIRDEDIYTEILFYSQDGESKLREEMTKNKIDGVYCASRGDAIEILKKVILTTIQKTQEINNLRGLVMAETSELDNLMKIILLSKEWSEEHFNHSHQKINDFHTSNIEKLSKYLPYDPNNIILLVHGHLTAWTSHLTLKKFLTGDEWDVVKGYQEIMKKRNVLAHGVEESSTVEKVIVKETKPDGSEVTHEFTPEDFISLRKEIRSYKDAMKKLLSS